MWKYIENNVNKMIEMMGVKKSSIFWSQDLFSYPQPKNLDIPKYPYIERFIGNTQYKHP